MDGLWLSCFHIRLTHKTSAEMLWATNFFFLIPKFYDLIVVSWSWFWSIGFLLADLQTSAGEIHCWGLQRLHRAFTHMTSRQLNVRYEISLGRSIVFFFWETQKIHNAPAQANMRWHLDMSSCLRCLMWLMWIFSLIIPLLAELFVSLFCTTR